MKQNINDLTEAQIRAQQMMSKKVINFGLVEQKAEELKELEDQLREAIGTDGEGPAREILKVAIMKLNKLL